MKYQIILSFFVLLSMKDILLTQSSPISSMLNWLDTKIASKAEIYNEKIRIQNAKTNISDIIRNAFASARNHRMIDYGHPEKITVSPLGKKCQHLEVKEIGNNVINAEDSSRSKIIYDVMFSMSSYYDDAEKTEPFSLVPRNLSNAEIAVTTKNLKITVEVKLRRETYEPYSKFTFLARLNFIDFVLSSNRTNDGEFSFDISYKRYYVGPNDYKNEIQWSWGELSASSTEEYELTRKMVPLLPLLLRKHINCNPEFSQAFDEITKIVQQHNIL